MSVVDFAAAKLERSPHSAGKRVCLGCNAEWMGVAPLGLNDGLECPECGLQKGVTKFLYGADEGDTVLRCDCGCDHLFAHKAKGFGTTYLSCMACGTNLTDAFFS